MAGTRWIRGPIAPHNFLHSMKTAQSREPRIEQCSLDLLHPETHGTFNPGGHLRRHSFNQHAIAGYGCQSVASLSA